MQNVEQTIISQYGTSAIISQLVQNMNQYFDQSTNWENFYNFVWNVNTAQGFGLDIWGTIVGVSRLLHVPNTSLTFGFQDGASPADVTPFNVGPFNSTGSVSTQTYLLPDAGYRTLILTKALSNISAMSAPAINQLLQNLFQGEGNAYVIDNLNMTMTFYFNFPLTVVQEAIISQSGVLAHPAGVGVNILVGGLSAIANPTNLVIIGLSSSETTASVTVTAGGGSGSYAYAWTFQSGGADITITSPSSATTTFSSTGLAVGQSNRGTALCTVTDSSGNTATCTVSVTVGRAFYVSASASPASISYTGNSAAMTTGMTTVTAAGGLAPYTYSWAFTSGGTGITIGAPTSPSTAFSVSALGQGDTDSGTATCTVTDSLGQTTTVNVPVSITRLLSVTVSVSPSSATSSGSATTQTTNSVTATASGGSGSYTYSWAFTAGGTDLTINSPTLPTTTFTGSGMTQGNNYTGTATCTVTDTLGNTGSASASVAVDCIAFTPVLHLYTNVAGGTETIPSGASNVTIEIWGGGEPGAYGGYVSPPIGLFYGGGGGGGGAYTRSTYSTSVLTDITYGSTTSIGGNLEVDFYVSGTYTSLAVFSSSPGSGISGGAGGLASEGNAANVNGNTGGNGTSSSINGDQTAGAGGAAIAGLHAGPYGAGGAGSLDSTDAPSPGSVGAIAFYYT